MNKTLFITALLLLGAAIFVQSASAVTPLPPRPVPILIPPNPNPQPVTSAE